MGAWFEQFIRLISSDLGNLVYHLLLSFSIMVALALILLADAPSGSARRSRALAGLVLLLLIQFGLFIASGLTWQGIMSGQVYLPPLDRAATLLSLVVILWLWCFPDPTSVGDAGATLLGLLVIVGTTLSTLLWSNQPQEQTFNGSNLDIEASIFGISAAVLGIIVLLATRVDGYWYGVAILAVMSAGFGLHLAFLPDGTDYPSLARLGQMIAFPFLALLSQRLPASEPTHVAAESAADTGIPAETTPSAYDDPVLWQDLARLSADGDTVHMARDAAGLVAQSLQADLCLLLAPPDGGGDLRVLVAYDRLNKRYLEVSVLPVKSMPAITAAWRNIRNRRIAASNGAADLAFLAGALGLEKINNLLFHPVLSADGKSRLSVILVDVESGKDWDEAQQEYLTRISKLVVQFLQRNREMAGLRDDVTQARQTARLAQDHAQQALEEKQKLQSRSVVIQENAERDRAQIASLTAIAAAHEIALQTIEQLQADIAHLRESQQAAEKTIREREVSHEGEMRLALQEIALMQQTLYEADSKIAELKVGRVDGAPSGSQFENIAAIAKEMRQLFTSLKNNHLMLLDGDENSLDTRQRKLLQRVNVSIERIDRLIDDLRQTLTPESNKTRTEFEKLDVRDLIQHAVVESDSQLRRRRISVRLEMPPDRLVVVSDRHVLRTILSDLLENAGLASPEGGQVVVRARPETRENEDDYALIQVADSGSGIPAADFIRVFSPRTNGDLKARPISGLGKTGPELPQVKTMVDALGGYTWVDSILGHGATFSVLIPAVPVGSKNGRKALP